MTSPTTYRFDLPASELSILEQVACTPFRVQLQTSEGWDRDDDWGEYSASVRCKPHAIIYGKPVVFERSCKYTGSWVCETDSEILMAELPDGDVHIRAVGVSLAEAYGVFHYFFPDGRTPWLAIERYPSEDPQNVPLDECEVRAMQGEELRLRCLDAERRVQRAREKGMTLYRQHPVPGCTGKGNPPCANKP